MKRYEKRTETVERTVLVEHKCDLCGRAAKGETWGGGVYEVNETEVEVTVRHKEGNSYPSGGSGTEFVIDLCPWCFKDRLVPWLRSQGAAVEEKDWDW